MDARPSDGIARAGLNQRVYVDGPYVTPLAVVEDSRCPVGVQACGLPGDLPCTFPAFCQTGCCVSIN